MNGASAVGGTEGAGYEYEVEPPVREGSVLVAEFASDVAAADDEAFAEEVEERFGSAEEPDEAADEDAALFCACATAANKGTAR